jgi:hypothetical protein
MWADLAERYPAIVCENGVVGAATVRRCGWVSFRPNANSRDKPSIFTSRRSSAFSLRVIESVDQL